MILSIIFSFLVIDAITPLIRRYYIIAIKNNLIEIDTDKIKREFLFIDSVFYISNFKFVVYT